MIKVAALPKEFKQYERVVFCGNTLENTPLIFTMSDYAPILIGKGEVAPVIWVSLPIDHKEGDWASLVAQNRSLNQKIQVSVSKATTEVKVGSITVIRATQISKDHAEVSNLDLKPLGFNITGDKTSLHVGGNTMSGNIVSNSRAFVGLG